MSASFQQSGPLVRSAVEVEALVRARQQTLSKAAVDRKIIGLVVHGVGEQPIGATLKIIASEFLTLLRTIDDDASIAATPVDEGDPHEVKLWFKAQGKDDSQPYVYELRFIEVWWAQAFQPPGVGRFLIYTGQLIYTQLKNIRNKKAAFLTDIEYWGPALWQRIVAELLIVPLIFAALVLLIASRITQFIIPKDKLPEPLAAAQRIVVNAATRHLGDMWVYMREPWEASRIRVRFEERFHQAVTLMDTPDHDNPNARVESVVVVAHSMGSAVAYEALTGRRMTQLITDRFEGQDRPRLHFVSVGSALNWAWDIAPASERFRFHRQLSPAVDWLNLWSGPDPVARGMLTGPFVEPGDLDWDRGRWKPDGSRRVADADELVINQSDIFSDHSAYWNNAEEVLAPILDRITGGALTPGLALNKRARRSRVSVLALFKAAALLVMPIVFVAASISGMDGRLIDLLPEDVLGLKPDWLKREYLSPPVVAASMGILATFVYSSIIKWLWDWWDRSVKYNRLRVH